MGEIASCGVELSRSSGDEMTTAQLAHEGRVDLGERVLIANPSAFGEQMGERVGALLIEATSLEADLLGDASLVLAVRLKVVEENS